MKSIEKPLVLIHGGGSTIQTSFGRILPLFSNERQLIYVELQANGRTSDRDSELSFEQDTDDVAGILKISTLQNQIYLALVMAGVLHYSHPASKPLQQGGGCVSPTKA